VIVEFGSTPSPDQLYIVDPSSINNNIKSYPWQLDSTRKVTGVIDPCVILPSPPVYTVYYYHADALLTSNSTGYMASATNCCRPLSLQNLFFQNNYIDYSNPPPQPGMCPPIGPGPAGNAIVSFIKIPPLEADFVNNTPRFTSIDTILVVCKNRSFAYSLLASDSDGDSLAYHLSTPRTYQYDAVNEHTTVNYFSFPELTYKSPFSPQQPAGNNVTLDPLTGLLKGSITDIGTYILTVSVPEYRKGKVIDSITQDLFVRVLDCDSLPKPKASIPSLNSCNDFTLTFPNNSTPLYPNVNFNNTTFQWDFGDGGSSSLVYPIHTYSDTGTYNVRLIIFPGLYCADTAYSNALIYPYLTASFVYNDSCSNQIIQFTNSSTSSGGVINSSTWQFKKDSLLLASSDQYNASYSFVKAPQTYNVMLTVATDKGCMATDTQFINIWQSPKPLASHDTILSRGAAVQLFVDDGDYGLNASFLWSPSLGLSSATIADPILISSTDTIYYVTVKNNFGCSETDSIRVKYYAGPQIYVPNAFTPNNDGKNDILKPIPVGMQTFRYFRVYNRYGQLVFETNKPFAGWDGYYKSSPAPQGTYVWEVAGIDYNHKPFAIKGTVILLR
jgi:gliding motility-associated-like protein